MSSGRRKHDLADEYKLTSDTCIESVDCHKVMSFNSF